MELWLEEELLIEMDKYTFRENGRMDLDMEEEWDIYLKESMKDNGRTDSDMVMEMFRFILPNTLFTRNGFMDSS